MSGLWTPILSALGVIVAVFAAWRSVQESALRRDEVLTWANEAISALQTLLLLCMLPASRIGATPWKEKLLQVIFDTSVLVERGRMFFANVKAGRHGREAESAYRGHRPRILDHLIVAHQVACRLEEADADSRKRMHFIASTALREFVSLAQKEVGRSRTVSEETAVAGKFSELDHLLKQIDEKRFAEFLKGRHR